MGQTVVGILLGCEVPKGVELYSEEAALTGLLDRWERTKENKGKWHCQIESPFEGDKNIIGVWVICEHGSDKGVPDMHGKCLRFVDIMFSEEEKAARKKWDHFAAWAKKHGVEFDQPALWIAPTEVA